MDKKTLSQDNLVMENNSTSRNPITNVSEGIVNEAVDLSDGNFIFYIFNIISKI